ncbi:MAG: ATP-binding protein [Bacteroidales bacterium]|nr:ATP-binding protein [Candidatus Colicola equi]
MFERNALTWLREWKEKANRKPLIIRGARQVGKTSLVDVFGKEFDCYLKFNLDIAEDLAIFTKEMSIHELYSILLAMRGKTKDEGATLIFIDEIQNSPLAIKMLRYFKEELPQVYVIAAGSLLETMLKDNENISFPVGRVEYMALRPCTFDEFLGAIGETGLKTMVQQANVPEVLHSRVMQLFNKYSLIGGMPQAVAEYARTQDIVALTDIYQSLLIGYRDDVEKYTRSETSRNVIRHIIKNGWNYADEQITFEHFASSAYKSREVGEAMRTLEKTMLIELVYPSIQTALPIVQDMKKRPRLMWLDTGLMNYAAGIQSELYAIDDLNDAWRGKVAEHIVGQEILGMSNLFLDKRAFWVRESKNSQAELDYLYISPKFGLVPIEVKAGANAHLRSLQAFMKESPCTFAIRFWNKPMRQDRVTLDNGKEYTLYSLPYYYAGQLGKVLDKNN